MFRKKTNQISDILHGSIQISELEKGIISTQVFNRLHHVLQNSTAYLTFPTNKTSRFAHSIGVMHLGGEMFRYSITNGDAQARDMLLDFVNNFLKDLSANNEEFRHEAGRRLPTMHRYKKQFEELKSQQFDDPLYTANSPFIIQPDKLYLYLVVYQSLRVSALLHDLGHPPFSHITEDALDSIYASLQSRVDRQGMGILTPREEEYYKIIREYKGSGDKLHERLSKYLVKHVFSVVTDELSNDESATYKAIFLLHIKYVTLAILNDETKEFKEIHKIVDGVVDCDRLDYVSRDPLASGFDDGKIEYGRIVKTMKLVFQPDDKSFRFCVSRSVMNTVEDFLNRRWRLYKHVILHHRVVKTDTLLNQTIRSLADEYLSDNALIEADDEQYGYTIPDDISGLWKTVAKSFNLTQADYINHFIQWDDSWLLSCLRRSYFKRKHEDIKGLTTIQLEELLSNKKYYFSLYKRFDGLLPIDLALLKHFNADHLQDLLQRIESREKSAKSGDEQVDEKDKLSNMRKAKASAQIVARYKTEYEEEMSRKGGSWAARVPVHGLFLIAVTELFSNLGRDHELLSIFKSLIEVIKQEYRLEDMIVKRSSLSTGLNDERILYDEHTGQPVSIQSTSRIELDLRSNKGVFPPYFIYLYAERNLSDQELNNMKDRIGALLAEGINQYISLVEVNG